MTEVEGFIVEQPKKFQAIYKKLRQLILNEVPQMEEKLVYGIPFFYLKKRIFYFAPKETGVDLGFCNGYLLADHPVLEVKNRSMVRTILIRSADDIKEEILIPIIHEAVLAHL